jgi:CheY-like chemotaxis protein
MDRLRAFVARRSRQVLLLMPDGPARREVVERLAAVEVGMLAAESGGEALRMLSDGSVDCLVVDESVEDLDPQDVVEVLARRPVTQLLPVVFFGAPGNKGGEEMLARWRHGEGALALREAQSTERLLDYVYFFLHRSTASLSQDERLRLEELHGASGTLTRKRALLVDDDMRNIFALATVLDEQGMEIVSANNGRDAIRIVETDPNLDVVLMDIMMPEMDGITTIKEIKKLPRGGELPIIAVTAKAMKGDREKCIAAGAWDYLSKPVDRQHLLAVLRGWLHR